MKLGAEREGASSFQVFTKSARGWAFAALDNTRCDLFRSKLIRSQLAAVAHRSYLLKTPALERYAAPLQHLKSLILN